jgi:hypothetical protein
LHEIDALDRMRCTAALLSCTPTISARLVYDDVIVLEAMRPPHPVRDHAVVPPCWFRALVADGMANGLPAGSVERVRFERLLACGIDLGVRDGTTLLSANVLRVDAGPSWLHLHAVAAPCEVVEPIAVAVAEELGDGDEDPPLELHAAHDLDVTVLAQASAKEGVASEAAADLLRTISMRLAVERLERHLASIAAHPSGVEPPTRRHRDR